MSKTIFVNYDEIYARTQELTAYLSDELLSRIENEHRQIQEMLDAVDSATNAALKEAMELGRKKSIMVAQTLDKLLSFMENSSKQLELNEEKMAEAIASGRENTSGGEA